MIINDSNGPALRVTDNGYALAYTAMMTMEAHSCDGGDAYTALINIDPNVATCDFFYLKNTSDKLLRIYKIKGYTTAVDCEISLKTGVTGTPTSAVNIVPINSLIGSGKTAECTSQISNGTVSMALTGGNVYDTLFLDKDYIGEQRWHFTSEITLEKNQTFCMYSNVDPTAAFRFTVYFYFHEKVE